MPNALEIAAENLAPTKAKTNYFDPVEGQTVVSRYANAKREAADSDVAAEASDRLLQSRDNRLLRQRDRVKWSRDDKDYQEKHDYKVAQGNFLMDIAQIDPEADDFEKQISTLHASLPPAALEDPAVDSLISAKRKRADDLLNERQYQGRREEMFSDRERLMKLRYENDPRLNVLTPEQRQQFYGEDGEFDSVGAGQLAFQIAREAKKADNLEVANTKRQWKIEDRADEDLDEDSRRLKTLAKEHVLGDTEAFPNQVEGIRTRLNAGRETPVKDDKVKADPGYESARRYESKKFESELESARNMTQDAYVAAGGKSDSAKKKRLEVWQAAHAGATPEEPVPGGAKTLDIETAKKFREQAGGDKTKARELARAAGYSF